MRKLLVVIAALGLVFVPVSSAAAQTTGLRDPFDPLLSVDAGGETATGTTAGTGTDVDDPTVPDDSVAPPTDDELPTTGADPTNWLAAAYILVALGGGLVASAKLLRPSPRRVELRG